MYTFAAGYKKEGVLKFWYTLYILTLDEDPDADYDGIKRINALQWMVDE